MKRSTDRILTTHTGSLHRPADLEEMFLRKYTGLSFNPKALEARLRSAVAEVVKKQAELGVDIVDDGEFGKISFWTYAENRIRGIERRPLAPAKDTFFRRAAQSASSGSDRERFAQFYSDTESPEGANIPPSLVQLYMPVGTAYDPPASFAVVGPLEYDPAEIRQDIENMKLAVRDCKVEEVFMPVTAPGMFVTRNNNEYYKTEDEYYQAVADVFRQEYLEIVRAGFILQVDDVSLPGRHRLLAQQGDSKGFERWAARAVEALNHALRDIPEDKVRYHMCWSAHNAPHTDDAPLEEIFEPLMKIKAQAYQIEAANPRHEHEYHVWEKRKLPEGKILMPGIVGHATNVIEHPEAVAERILRYTNAVGRENVVAATDCGFRWRVHPQIAWAKLQVLAEGARIATRKLYPH